MEIPFWQSRQAGRAPEAATLSKLAAKSKQLFLVSKQPNCLTASQCDFFRPEMEVRA
jgi:hypothetical protein